VFRRLAVIVTACLTLAGTASATDEKLPWGQSSDMAAWQTFSLMVAPSGNPANHTAEFETWATDQDIYTASPHWPAPGTPKQLQPSLAATAHEVTGVHSLVITPNECFRPGNAAAGNFPATGCIGEEVRRNFASYQYIVANGLYSTAGLARAFKTGLKVDLPPDAIEFKGDWVRVVDLIAWLKRTEGLTLSRARVGELYYVNVATSGRTTDEFALVGFHFATKQIKNWVWADFEHRLNPGRCDTIGCHDDFGATNPVVQPKATANQNYGECQKTPALLAMLANAGLSAVWQNYCLKGAEIDFIQANGKPQILGNSVIERIDANIPVGKSSCITCHAYASFDAKGNHGLLTFTNTLPVGRVDETRLKGYASNDFIWGIANLGVAN
jgi:hypothetical protein